MTHIEIGAVYRHYKGNYYQVICIARHSETLEDLVVYQKLYEDFSFWVRPKKIFLEKVQIGNKKVSRFQKINNKILIKQKK